MTTTVVLIAVLGLLYLLIWTDVSGTIDVCLDDLRRTDKAANPHTSRYNPEPYAVTTPDDALTTDHAGKLRLFTGEFSYP